MGLDGDEEVKKDVKSSPDGPTCPLTGLTSSPFLPA